MSEPLPPDFGLSLDPGVRRPVPTLLVGGSPVRVLRLSDPGAALLDQWLKGQPVGRQRGAGAMARRLVDAGLANPAPPPLDLPTTEPPRAGSSTWARCAVAIPVRNDQAGLDTTVASISETAPWVSIRIVDDGSDPPVEIPDVRRHGETSVTEKLTVMRRATAGGPGAARNIAWRSLQVAQQPAPGAADSDRSGSADIDFVVFVDAGVITTPGWLELLLSHFADPALGAVAPRVLARRGTRTPRGLSLYERRRSALDMGSDPAIVRPASKVAYVPSAAIAVRTEALRQLGGFDEALRFGEDVDLVWRLSKAGWRVRYEPAAAVTHPDRETTRAWLRQRYDYGRSAAPLACRHGSAAAPLAASWWSLGFWALLSGGRLRAAAAVATGTSVALAFKGTRRGRGTGRTTRLARRQTSSDWALAFELARLALVGNLRFGPALAGALRRAWTPPATALLVSCWPRMGSRGRSFAGITTAAVLVLPGVSDWWSHRGDGLGILPWCCLRVSDDLAYQAGLWVGSFESRSAGALVARFGAAKSTSWAASPV